MSGCLAPSPAVAICWWSWYRSRCEDLIWLLEDKPTSRFANAERGAGYGFDWCELWPTGCGDIPNPGSSGTVRGGRRQAGDRDADREDGIDASTAAARVAVGLPAFQPREALLSGGRHPL